MDPRMKSLGKYIVKPQEYRTLNQPSHPTLKPAENQHQYGPSYMASYYPRIPPGINFKPPVYSNRYYYEQRKNLYNQRGEPNTGLPKSVSLVSLLTDHSAIQTAGGSVRDDSMLDMVDKIQKSLKPQFKPNGPANFGRAVPEYGLPLNYFQYQPDEGVQIYSEEASPELSFGHKKLSGIRKLRSFMFSVIFPIRLYNDMIRRKNRWKSNMIEGMTTSIGVAMDMTHNWLIEAIRDPVLRIVNNPELDLDVFSPGTWKDRHLASAKALKVKLRVQELVGALCGHVSKVPTRLKIFLGRYVGNGSPVGVASLLPFESSRVTLDESGTLRNQTKERKHMMLAFFIISKVLIPGILLKPEQSNFYVHTASRSKMNLKLMASILQYLVVNSYLQVGRPEKYRNEDRNFLIYRKASHTLGPANDDKISQILFTYQDMAPLFSNLETFINQMRQKLLKWCDDLLTVSEESIRKLSGLN